MVGFATALLLTYSFTVWPGDAHTAYKFVQVTDVHMEPFYNPEYGHAKGDVCRAPEAYNKSQCVPFKIEPMANVYPLGRLNCDGPEALLHSLFTHIAKVSEEERPEFGFFTGDLPSHQLSCQRHQLDVIEIVIKHLAEHLKPTVGTVYPAMGNNDYFPNYNISLEPNSPWQELIASIYAKHGFLEDEQLWTFRRGGFYSANPKPGLKIIVLNTVVWSMKLLDWDAAPKSHVHHIPDPDEGSYVGPDSPLPGADDSGWEFDKDVADKKIFVPCHKRPADPYGQLSWWKGELHKARLLGERVIIAGHVPPGNKVGDNNFCPQHTSDFEDITREYQDIIEVQLYGDHSNDEFRMVWSKEPGAEAISAILVSAGVTPRKHCNPSWRMFDVIESHKVKDFTQYYLPLEQSNLEIESMPKPHTYEAVRNMSEYQWQKQYSFMEQYGVGLSPPELQGLWEDMQLHPALLRTYVRNMYSQTIGNRDYFDYICDMRYLQAKSNDKCAQKGRIMKRDHIKLHDWTKHEHGAATELVTVQMRREVMNLVLVAVVAWAITTVCLVSKVWRRTTIKPARHLLESLIPPAAGRHNKLSSV
eukprot:gnl/TRDRNA2_/TRDRNA2_173542_c2_seq2.p1 gnl/TRDRNA2_/TRDRNA2_173542_c2~~gnl/TRDRNA2_/TRDRNA2_173542_c2_seq2.p1  ORF type:complete len:620 (-),score=65.58 gnl/TRDRNA2_/TRDRNA2_173542_c2_seq2:252-2009(-)